MRRFSLSSLALLCVSHAYAADLPPISNYRAPAQVVAERFTWTGVYVGANAGYAWGKVSNTAGTLSDPAKGAFAGGQVGANYQTGVWVFGVEGDMQASWQKRTLFSGVALGGVS